MPVKRNATGVHNCDFVYTAKEVFLKCLCLIAVLQLPLVVILNWDLRTFLQQRFWHHSRISDILFMSNTHFVGQKPQYPSLPFFFFPLHPFAFPLHFFLQGVVFIHQWKTLITPFWWGFRSDGAAVLCAA